MARTIDEILNKDELTKLFHEILDNYDDINGIVIAYSNINDKHSNVYFDGSTPMVLGLLQLARMDYNARVYDAIDSMYNTEEGEGEE